MAFRRGLCWRKKRGRERRNPSEFSGARPPGPGEKQFLFARGGWMHRTGLDTQLGR